MSDGVALVSVWAACVAGLGFAIGGFTWLGQAMHRHHADLFGRGSVPPPARVQRLRWQGTIALTLALAACVLAEGWAYGVVYWAGLLTVGAWAVVAAFSWAPLATPRLAKASVTVGAAAALLSPWLAH
ncbi:DUF3325 domain-containing protein [Cupriavidus sp. H18C2]|uniref:DUF3325 domain-containing protein n=1 Tax=Cupriavidus sp. H18C2 TaxID=3241602 RepID=UPI003BF8025F